MSYECLYRTQLHITSVRNSQPSITLLTPCCACQITQPKSWGLSLIHLAPGIIHLPCLAFMSLMLMCFDTCEGFLLMNMLTKLMWPTRVNRIVQLFCCKWYHWGFSHHAAITMIFMSVFHCLQRKKWRTFGYILMTGGCNVKIDNISITSMQNLSTHYVFLYLT